MIVVRIWEGLGNQMFQYAFARALQEHTKDKVYLEINRLWRTKFDDEDLGVERDYGLNNMNISLKVVDDKQCKRWNYCKQEGAKDKVCFWLASKGLGRYIFLTDKNNKYSYDKSFFEVNRNAYIMGHFFNKKYYDKIKDILIEEFTLKKDIQIDNSLREVLQLDGVVSLHIRRGDYVKRGTCLPFDRYYRRAMEFIKHKVKEPFFLIFTDDVKWVNDNLHISNSMVVSNDDWSDCEELQIMSKCKNNIIANSTFSYWAAWLNKNPHKIVIVPQGWMTSVIPNEWIRI